MTRKLKTQRVWTPETIQRTLHQIRRSPYTYRTDALPLLEHLSAENEQLKGLVADLQAQVTALTPKTQNPTVHVITYGESEWDTLMIAVGANCDGMGLGTLQELEKQLQEECPEELNRCGIYHLELTAYEPPTDYGDGFAHNGFWEFKVLAFEKHTWDTQEFQEGIEAFLKAVDTLPELNWQNITQREQMLQAAREQCPYPDGRQRECWLDGWDSQKAQADA